LNRNLPKSHLRDKNDDIQKSEVYESCNEDTDTEGLTGSSAENSNKIMNNNYFELCSFRLYDLMFLKQGS
jgi:hypothetical protein